jgi:hypothetical protein
MPLRPTDPLVITLQAQEWSVVLTAVQEAPMPLRLTRPVVDKLERQFQERSAMPSPNEDRVMTMPERSRVAGP